MRLVGLCGYLGSGKSLAATALKDVGYEVHPFAKVLKDMLVTFGLTEAQVRGSEKNIPLEILGGATPRHAMQTLGTEWGRTCICDDLWLLAWWNKVRDLSLVVCDDVRFENEVDFIRSKGGLVVQISRPGHGPGRHLSEKMAFEPDLVIENAGTVEELADSVKRQPWY